MKTQRIHTKRSANLGRIASAVMIALLMAVLPMAGAVNAAPGSTFAIGDMIVVDTDLLNLRAEPTIAADIVAVLLDGSMGQVTDGPVERDGYVWYEYEVDGLAGWSVVDFLDLHADTHEALPPATEIIVVTDLLNVRLAPDLGSLVIDAVARGTRGQVLDGPVTAGGYEWYQVAFTGITGWIAREYIAFGSAATVLDFAAGEVAIVNTDQLNVRTAAGLSANVVGILDGGAEVVILGEPTEVDGYLWYEIETDDITGWVAGTFLRAS